VITVFLILLVMGLVLGVFAMLYGTEKDNARNSARIAPHERRSEHDISAEPSSVFNLASIAAFAFGAGLTGYLIDRYTTWPVAGVVITSIIVGAAALALQSILIARWAIPGARSDQIDERFLLQGTVGRVTREIPPGGTGEIHYALDGGEYSLPAREFEGGTISAGGDIVIERIENGVAYVERWSQVEQRL
jgi:hypothetical protein